MIDKNEFIPKKLPLKIDIETKDILKKVNIANKALAELKGITKTIPNGSILINTLILQEAKDSSEVENIITTHDELYKSDIDIEVMSNATKEVKNYTKALKHGFELIKENKLLIIRYIEEIQIKLEDNDAGIRRQSGTALKNASTDEIVYMPPQRYEVICDLLKNLEEYINIDDDIDPLIKMAIIHYQFESIHPFYDGNGRTGRIINVLYLILKDLLDIPILYLSRFIIKNKFDYYRLLQEVRTKNSWEEWILYILQGVEETSKYTIDKINSIKILMKDIKLKIIEKENKIYSKDLLEILFLHPYTKIEFLVERLNISRQTASKYLEKLEGINIVKKEKIGNRNYYVNTKLYELLSKK